MLRITACLEFRHRPEDLRGLEQICLRAVYQGVWMGCRGMSIEHVDGHRQLAAQVLQPLAQRAHLLAPGLERGSIAMKNESNCTVLVDALTYWRLADALSLLSGNPQSWLRELQL